MRAAIYLRQSLDREGTGLAIDRQRVDCRKLCETRGWTVVREFVDNDTSASSGKRRPAYEAMLTAIEGGEIDAVVVWDLDRLTRRPIEIETFIDLADRRRIALASVGGDADLSTDNGRLFARIKGAVARAEVERKSARQKSSIAQAATAGRRVAGQRPFGYERDGVTVRPTEADALTGAYSSVLAGTSLREVARALNAKGLHTPQLTRTGEPSQWQASTLRSVLLNPRYAGFRAHLDVDLARKYVTNPVLGRIAGIVIGDDGQPVAAQWPAIVPEETWRAVVALLTDPARTNRRRSDIALLTSIAACGVCGALVFGGRAKGGKTYRCRAARGHVVRAQAPVDDYLAKLVVARLRRPDAVSLFTTGQGVDLGALRTEAAALRVRREALATDYAEGVLSREQLHAGTKRIEEKLAVVETKLAEAGRENMLAPFVGRDPGEVWDGLSHERRRAVISALVTVRLMPPGRGTRTFRPETVAVEWMPSG